MFDEEAGKLLDEQSGISKSGVYDNTKGETNGFHATSRDIVGKRKDVGGFTDKGGASRFFYCPKASKKERNAGIENKTIDVSRPNFVKGGLKCEICNKWKNSGSPCICDEPQFIEEPFNRVPNSNTHPTIKPLALMEYLIRMTTRPGGVVLDCFMGSGSTGVAAKRNGFSFIGVEKEQEYFNIAQQRIDYET
jgi:site-specific DNA-methyltransferase (adenine-specific)